MARGIMPSDEEWQALAAQARANSVIEGLPVTEARAIDALAEARKLWESGEAERLWAAAGEGIPAHGQQVTGPELVREPLTVDSEPAVG